MWDKIYKLFSRVRHSKSGIALIYFALIMPVFVGFAGLAFDATLWFMEKRQLQTIVDSAAMTGAYTMLRGGDIVDISAAAIKDAEDNGFQIGVGNPNTIVVSSPPASGGFAGVENHVMVIITAPAVRYFTNILGLPSSDIVVIAVAATEDQGESCILALSPDRDKALEFTGSSVVDIDCGVAAASSSDTAIYLNGKATLIADPSAQAFGDIFVGGNADLDVDLVQPNTPPPPDPYGSGGRNLSVSVFNLVYPQSLAVCDETDRDVKGNEGIVTLDPGRYCDGLTISAGAEVILNTGMYIIDGGDFRVAGNSKLDSFVCANDDDPCGVTFILTAENAADVATVTINGGADMELMATNSFVTDDPDKLFAGILFYQDRKAVYEDGVNSFLGGSDMTLSGALYFPSQEVRYTGGTDVDTPPKCLQIIANKVTFSGNATLANADNTFCATLGVTIITSTIVKLVE